MSVKQLTASIIACADKHTTDPSTDGRLNEPPALNGFTEYNRTGDLVHELQVAERDDDQSNPVTAPRTKQGSEPCFKGIENVDSLLQPPTTPSVSIDHPHTEVKGVVEVLSQDDLKSLASPPKSSTEIVNLSVMSSDEFMADLRHKAMT